MLNVKELANEAIKDGLQLPPPAKDGRYNTLNYTGAMYPKITEPDEIFIQLASQPRAQVLDIGAAYGLTCLEALKRGATHYVAVDIEEKHLKILAREVVDKMPEKQEALILIRGAFPKGEVLEYLKENSFDAIMAGNVLHFLTEQEVKEAFRQFALLLRPGGKLIATVTSPHIAYLKQEVRDKFEIELNNFQRATDSEKAEVVLPGFIENIRQAAEPIVTAEAMDGIALTKAHLFLFDRSVAKYLLEKEGFIIEKCDYYSVDGLWKIEDKNQDNMIIIAQKPSE